MYRQAVLLRCRLAWFFPGCSEQPPKQATAPFSSNLNSRRLKNTPFAQSPRPVTTLFVPVTNPPLEGQAPSQPSALATRCLQLRNLRDASLRAAFYRFLQCLPINDPHSLSFRRVLVLTQKWGARRRCAQPPGSAGDQRGEPLRLTPAGTTSVKSVTTARCDPLQKALWRP